VRSATRRDVNWLAGGDTPVRSLALDVGALTLPGEDQWLT